MNIRFYAELIKGCGFGIVAEYQPEDKTFYITLNIVCFIVEISFSK